MLLNSLFTSTIVNNTDLNHSNTIINVSILIHVLTQSTRNQLLVLYFLNVQHESIT